MAGSDERLRASILIPIQSAELAVAEIERLAPDKRFVQVMTLAAGETMLGRRHHWPIYEACQRHGLPFAIHAGSSYRHPPTAVGWPSYHIEDYVSQAITFQSQLASLLAEGVFKKFPDLKVVILESGFTWLPAFLWRFKKYWRGLTMEIPWVDEPPTNIVRDHVRFSLTPFDGPEDPAQIATHIRTSRFRRNCAILDRLSALAVRRRRSAAAWPAGAFDRKDIGRQPASNLPAAD